MTEEYKAYLAHKQSSPPVSSEDFIAHYGVKGQKWGVRNYQYADGGYTPAGAQRYWGGTGKGRAQGRLASTQKMTRPGYNGGINPGNMTRPGYNGGINPGNMARPHHGIKYANGSRSRQNVRAGQNGKSRLTAKQQAARRSKAKKVLAIGAGVAVAAALGYAAYKGSTNLRDQQRENVLNTVNTDWRNVHTMNSKYWDAADRRKYNEMSKQRAQEMANSVTRRDAVAAKFQEKTGIQINMPKSREAVLRERRGSQEYGNALREFEKRGELNRKISDARKDLQRVQRDAQRSADTRFKSQDSRYGEHLNSQWDKQIEQRKEILNNLLLQRRAS